MAIDDMILREVEHPPLTTKGSELTWAELDQNWIELFDELAGIRNAAGVQAWNEFFSYYTGEFVTYDSKLYIALQGTEPTDNEGNLPDEEDSLFWQLASAGQLLSSASNEPVKSYTGVQLAQMKQEGRLIPGGRYKCSDFVFEDVPGGIILTACTSSSFYLRVVTTVEDRIMNVDTSDSDSDNWVASFVQNFPVDLNLSNGAVYNPTTKALTIATAKRYGETFNLIVDPWEELVSYEIDDIVEVDDLVYICLVANDGVEPGTSPSYWELLHDDGIPQIETINDISSTHYSNFEVETISALLIATPTATAVAGDIILNQNTNVLLTGYGVLQLKDTGGINRQTGGALLN